MQKFVVRKNIEKFRLLLAGTLLDPAARKEVERLLSEELAKLGLAETVMWDADGEGSTVLHPLVAHETAMLLGDMCGLRLSLGPSDGHPKMIARVVQVKLTLDQAQALARDIQQLSDWTRLSPEERKLRATVPASEVQKSQPKATAQLGLSEPRFLPMEKPSALWEKAALLRDEAVRALRLAVGLSEADQARLRQLGEELREQAIELERQAETPPRPAERRPES